MSAQPESAQINAAELYRKAYAELSELAADERKLLDSLTISAFDPVSASRKEAFTQLAQRLEPAIKFISEASKSDQIDWQTQDDPSGWIKIGNSGKSLTRVMILKARMDIHENRFEDAANAFIAGMALSRHLGHDGVFMVKLIETASYRMTVASLAQEIPGFPENVVKNIQERLVELPASKTMKEVLQAERHFADQLGRQPDSVYPEEMMKGFLEFYDQLIESGHLSPLEFENQLKALGESYSDNFMIKGALPILPNMRHLIAVLEVKTLLFELGLKAQLQGPEIIDNSKDPFGNGPYEYSQLANNGFQLSSQLEYRGEKVTLKFGH